MGFHTSSCILAIHHEKNVSQEVLVCGQKRQDLSHILEPRMMTCRPRREEMSVTVSPWDSEVAFRHQTLTDTHAHTGR